MIACAEHRDGGVVQALDAVALSRGELRNGEFVAGRAGRWRRARRGRWP